MRKKKIINLTRHASILHIGMSDANDNNKKEVASLYVFSAWRIVDKEKNIIKVASGDRYERGSNISKNADFDWQIKGVTLLDEKLEKWFCENESIYVEDIHLSGYGDLICEFSNGDVIEVIANASETSECWRLFCETGEDTECIVALGGYIDRSTESEEELSLWRQTVENL